MYYQALTSSQYSTLDAAGYSSLILASVPLSGTLLSDPEIEMYGSPSFQSSGETPISTSSDATVTVLPANASGSGRKGSVTLINEGSVPGFFSFDGGVTWCRLPASYLQSFNNVSTSQALVVKRIAGGSNLSGIYAFASL